MATLMNPIYVTKSRSPYGTIATRQKMSMPTPQTQIIPGKEAVQAKNNAGGVSYKLDDWKRLERFLVLGTEGGTYYTGERKLTLENAQVVKTLIDQDGVRVVSTVVDVSEQNRAPKADPGLFCLALCASFGDSHTKAAVREALPRVARTGTHLYHFVQFASAHRGWGRTLREMVAQWFTSKDARSVAYQMSKYQQRDGWSGRDLLRLSHAKTNDPDLNAVFHWMVKGWTDEEFEAFDKNMQSL